MSPQPPQQIAVANLRQVLATRSADGLLSAEDKVKIDKNQFSAVDNGNAIRTIYVRLGGSDSSGNGSLASPYATVARALEDLYNTAYRLAQIIDCTGIGTQLLTSTLTIPPVAASGGPTLVDPTAPLSFFQFVCPVVIRAVPTVMATIRAGAYTVGILQAQGGGNSLSNLAVVTVTQNPGWTVNQWRRSFCYIPSLNSAGVIIANAANTLTVLLDAGFGFAGTPQFQILQTSAELRMNMNNPPATLNALGVGTGVSLQGLRISRAALGTPIENAVGVGELNDFRIEMCDIDGVTYAGIIATNPVLESSVIRGDANGPAGTNSYDAFACATDAIGSLFDACALNQEADGGYDMLALWCAFVGCNAVGHTTGTFPSYRYNLNNCLILNGVENGVQFLGGNPCVLSACEISGCAGDAIHASKRGSLDVTAVNGTGNTGTGVYLDRGSDVLIDATTSVVGASQITYGAAGTITTYAALRAAVNKRLTDAGVNGDTSSIGST